jgi:hypothetical protein
MALNSSSVRKTLEIGRELRLLSEAEVADVMSAFEDAYPFADAARLADTFHAHIKVDAVGELPHDALRAAGGAVENEKDGYIKYAFPSGMNLIFSSICVSQDDLREASSALRARPFLDHYGIDLRRELPEAQAAFEAIPQSASARGWGHVPQGGDGKLVYCCHVTVSAKHWVYPRESEGRRAVPVEIAYGPLTVNPEKSGCDLRPSDPRRGLGTVSACGGSSTR